VILILNDLQKIEEIKERWNGILEHTETEYKELAKIELAHAEKLEVLQKQKQTGIISEGEYEAEVMNLMLETEKRADKIHIAAEKRATATLSDDVKAVAEDFKAKIREYADKLYNEAVKRKKEGRRFQWRELRLTEEGDIFLDKETVLDNFVNMPVIRFYLERYAKDTEATAILETALSSGLDSTFKCNNVGVLGAIVNEFEEARPEQEPEKFSVKPIKRHIFLNDLNTWETFHSGSHGLTAFDYAVYNAVSTLWMNENLFVTANMINKAMTGNTETFANGKRKRTILLSVDKMNGVNVQTKQKKGKLLRLYPETGILNGQKTKGFRFHEAPFYYGIAENLRKRIKISPDTWDLSQILKMSDEIIVIRDYIYRRILQAGKTGATNVLYTSIIEQLGKSNLSRSQKLNIKSYTKKILEHFSGRGLCSFIPWVKDNKEVGITITIKE